MYHGYSKQSLNPERCPGILQSWLDKSDFVHSFQLLRKFPNEKYLTFGMNNMAKGIDHFFVSKNLSSNVNALKISDFEFAGSRHKSVTISVANLFDNPLVQNWNFEFLIYSGALKNSNWTLKWGSWSKLMTFQIWNMTNSLQRR